MDGLLFTLCIIIIPIAWHFIENRINKYRIKYKLVIMSFVFILISLNNMYLNPADTDRMKLAKDLRNYEYYEALKQKRAEKLNDIFADDLVMILSVFSGINVAFYTMVYIAKKADKKFRKEV